MSEYPVLQSRFGLYHSEYLRFERVEPRLASRPDLHAFILLNRLVPSNDYLIEAAEHDMIWLDVDLAKLETMATDDNIKDLVRCGVMYDIDLDCLKMNV